MPKKNRNAVTVPAVRSDYDVGYAKPPVKNRFKPGQSGNPRGRPKKQATPRIDPAMEPTQDWILNELYRRVHVRDGDQTVEMTAIQVTLRTLVNDAMAGKHAARKEVIQLAQQAEARQLELHLKDIDTWIAYKLEWNEEFKRCDEAGIPRPDPVLHPDDITLCPVTCKLTISGPIDQNRKAIWLKLQERIADFLDEIADYEEFVRNNPEGHNFSGMIMATCDVIEALALQGPKWRYRHYRLTNRNLEWPRQVLELVAAKRAQYPE